MPPHQNYFERLESAALSGKLEEVERLTRNQNGYFVCNYNFLKKIVSAGQTEVAKLIINRLSLNTFPCSRDCKEILHLAIATEDLELVELLIKGRVSIQIPDKDDIPPLFKIVQISSDNVDFSKFLDCFLANVTKHERINFINAKYQSRSISILHYAAEIGNDKILPALKEKHCHLNAKLSDGSTALHIAIKNRHSRVVEKLLELGVQDPLTNNEKMTPLHLAIKNGDFNIFNILLNHIRSVTPLKQYFQRKPNRSLVYLAASAGNIEMVEFLLSNEAGHIYCSKETGQTALHVAIERDDIQIVQLLLQYEAKLETTDKSGFTPLHVACATGNHAIVSMILDTGKCRLSAKSNKGLTALHLAAKKGHSEVVSLLLERGAKYKQFDNTRKTALSFALENTSNNKTVTILLEHIRQKENNENNSILLPEDHLLIKYHSEARNDKNGNSILHLAVEKEDKSAINLLLKLHACIDNLNKNGYTPFTFATVNGSVSVMKIFLESKLNLKFLFVSSREDGFTPMHFAVEEGNTDLLELFFKVGITADFPYKLMSSINTSEPHGLTPLHIAVQKSDKNLIHLLLRNRAVVDMWGRAKFETPIFTAAENGNTEVLEILSEASTSRSSTWKEGYLPMCIAAYRGHEKVVKMLLDKGVDPNANLDKYLTPLHAAAQQGHEKIVRLLIERGAMVNPKRNTGGIISTPLLGALFAKHSRIAQLLLKQGVDFNAQLLPRCISESGQSITNPSVLVTERILTQGNYSDSEIGEEGSLIGYRPLHFAVEALDKTAIRLLLNCGANVNFKVKNGATAIGLAIEKENEAIIKLLLSAGANILNSHRNKPILDIGVLKTNAKICELVVKYISSSHPNADGASVTPLGIAVENEFEACVEKLLKDGANVYVEHKEETLLYIAVKKKNLMMVRELLKYGFDVNYQTRMNSSIIAATENEDANIVELLLDAGANVEVYKALYKAVLKDNATIVEMFLKRGFIYSNLEYDSSFRDALARSSPEVVQKFFDCKASTDMDNKKGEDAIFYAIKGSNFEVVKYLLEAGASINAKTKEGETILHFAMSNIIFQPNIYQILVDHNVNLNAPSKENQSPMIRILKTKEQYLDYKYYRNCFMNFLLSNGVNPNELDLEEKSMLELAIDNEKRRDLEALLLHGADINFLNLRNKTPLEMAIWTALRKCDIYEAQYGQFINEENGSKTLDNLEYDKYYLLNENFEYEILPCREIVRLLVQEVARRQVAKEVINKENISAVSRLYVRKYFIECIKEISLMKKTEICQGITYFDILVAKINSLVDYARSTQVKRVVLAENELTKMFPQYGKIVINRIVMGRDRRYLLDSCYHFFKDFLHFNFPLLIVEHIFSFLENRDLRKLYITMKMSGNYNFLY